MQALTDTFSAVVMKDTVRIMFGMRDCKPWIRIVRARMKQRHVTQPKLAAVMGVDTRGAIGHYLTGRNEPSFDQFTAMAVYLGLQPGPLFEGREVDLGAKDDALAAQIANAVTASLLPKLLPETPEISQPHQSGREIQLNKERTRRRKQSAQGPPRRKKHSAA